MSNHEREDNKELLDEISLYLSYIEDAYIDTNLIL